ncbi:MAG: NADH-quinone oxidoreductase subunit NuoE [Gaiellaceae bacterium]
MAAALYNRIRKVAAKYPQRRSAVMPALRLAQEAHGGWLPPEALREVADALDLTPAEVEAVATFYDMFNLAPVGRHLVEVCTNLSCALAGAKQVVDALEIELGIPPGETSDDGEVTFRLIECAGGCGYAPVVVVDHRYREPTRPEDVPGLVEELRGR